MASFVSILESTGNTVAGGNSTIKLNTFTPHMGNLIVIKAKVTTVVAVGNKGTTNVSDLGILDSGYNYEVLTVKLHNNLGVQKFISTDSVTIDENNHVRFTVAGKGEDAYDATSNNNNAGTALEVDDVITIMLLVYNKN